MKVYLSSTFKDLVEYRRQAYRAMRSLELNVVAMEDYVARDDRPVDACLADVAASDLYVGVFAFRYGHIPLSENAEGRSVTELEYRKAVSLDIPRLIFLARPDWPMSKSDAYTGDGNSGDLINKLRAELQEEAVVDWFGSPDQLEAAVSKSVSVWLRKQDALVGVAPDRAQIVLPHRRQIQYDFLLLHAPTDAERATALVNAVSGVWSVLPSGAGLTAATAEDLKALDQHACAARSTGVLLSSAALTILAEDKTRSARTLGLVRERTGVLLGVPVEEVTEDATAMWGLTEILPFAAADGVVGQGNALHSALLRYVSRPNDPELGLPVVIVAMTDAEADHLVHTSLAPVAGLIKQRPDSWWLGRYGSSRHKWRPFEDSDNIDETLDKAVAKLNENLDRLRGWTIRLRPYSFEPLISDNLAMWPIYDGIAKNGCLVILDEVSLFNDAIRTVFESSPLSDARHVALVSLSPLDPMLGTPQALIRDKLDGYLAAAAHRFNVSLDPLCEMGVSQPRRLDRWLRESLPRAADVLREASRDPLKILEFEKEVGDRANPAMARLIAGEVLG